MRSPRSPAVRVREIRLPSGPDAAALPLYRRLYRHLRERILSGDLAPGMRLPSARTLAADLRLSRNTVEGAMAALAEEGLVARRIGAGTVVSDSFRDPLAFAPQRAAGAPRTETSADERRPAPSARLSRRGRRLLRLGRHELNRDGEFGPCATNVGRFPLQEWTRALARHARRSGVEQLLPADLRGLPALRAEIARHAALTRGCRGSADRVLVLGSAQEALDLIARVALDPGDLAAVEEPGYSGARAALQAAGAELVPVPVDGDGIVARSLPRRGRTRLAYVTPSHQFPIGATMSLARRLELLSWAAEGNAMVIEDDYDSEFRHDGQPLAALQSLPGGDRVFYLGTYNKVLFPGLRLAYLILPEPWVEPMKAARRATSGSASPLLQSVLAEFLASGRFAAYLRRARPFYARCRDALIDTIREAWPTAVRLGPSSTGLHVVAELPEPADDVELATLARNAGLPAVTLSASSIGRRPRRGLILNYGSSNPGRLADGARRFAPVLRRELSRLPRGPVSRAGTRDPRR